MMGMLKIRSEWRWLGALLIAICGCHAETRVIKNFTLIDGTGRPALPNAAMVVVDGRIDWVGPAAGVKAPAGAAITDWSGKFVMPGIINLHGHLGNTIDLVQDPRNFTRANVEKQLKVYARYGVTTMLTMGSEQPLILEMRAEQRRTNMPGETRIYTALRGFTGEGGYPTSAPGMKGVPYEVTTVDQVRKDVAELAANHVDMVKIWVDDHLGRERKIPFDLSKAIIENAHANHLKVAAHIFYLDDAKALVNAGLHALAHSVRDKPVDRALIDAMKSRGVYQVPTLTRELSTFVFAQPGAMLDDPYLAPSVSPEMMRTLKSAEFQKQVAAEPDTAHGRAWLEMAKKNLKTLYDAGVRIGFGTDTGPARRIQGYFEQLELELMAESGLTPAQILPIATKNAAEFLGAKDLGTLESGKWADLLVLSKDPLASVKNVRTIETVWIAGNKVN
jgi:imidazolonepropionase-like amidohydrolase